MTDYLHISPEVIGIHLNFPMPPDVNRNIDECIRRRHFNIPPEVLLGGADSRNFQE
jgi:hypothetical protein